jgi:hypothetical protein
MVPQWITYKRIVREELSPNENGGPLLKVNLSIARMLTREDNAVESTLVRGSVVIGEVAFNNDAKDDRTFFVRKGKPQQNGGSNNRAVRDDRCHGASWIG